MDGSHPVIVRKVDAFLGGMCNLRDRNGVMQRNPNRDELKTAFEVAGHTYYDPQIWGREYVYETDGPAEQHARATATVLFYEIGHETFAGVSMLEIMRDVATGRPVIIWLSGQVNEKNRPVYDPAGIDLTSIGSKATLGHVQDMIKQANSMRANLLDFLKGAENVRFVRNLTEARKAFAEAGIKI